MSKKATDTAAEVAAVQSTEAVEETLSTAELKAVLEKLEATEARAADAEQARADAESRAVAAETALAEARSAPAAPAAYPDYAELPAVVAAPLGLNLREGPAVRFGALDILPDGASVTVLPLPYGVAVPGWALVVSESGTIGWVMTEFLAEPPQED